MCLIFDQELNMPIFIKIREGGVGRCHFFHQLKNFDSFIGSKKYLNFIFIIPENLQKSAKS
jgi:hypothetical protein